MRRNGVRTVSRTPRSIFVQRPGGISRRSTHPSIDDDVDDERPEALVVGRPELKREKAGSGRHVGDRVSCHPAKPRPVLGVFEPVEALCRPGVVVVREYAITA